MYTQSCLHCKHCPWLTDQISSALLRSLQSRKVNSGSKVYKPSNSTKPPAQTQIMPYGQAMIGSKTLALTIHDLSFERHAQSLPSEASTPNPKRPTTHNIPKGDQCHNIPSLLFPALITNLFRCLSLVCSTSMLLRTCCSAFTPLTRASQHHNIVGNTSHSWII
jgi:hypothetical protein